MGKLSRVILSIAALHVVVLLLAVRVVESYTNGASWNLRGFIASVTRGDSTGGLPFSGSARLVLATLAIAVVVIALDRLARR